MGSKKRKIKRRSNKMPQKMTKAKEPYYKYFVLCCIILLLKKLYFCGSSTMIK